MTGGDRADRVMGDEPAIVAASDYADAALGRMLVMHRDRLAVVDSYGVIGICERNVLIAHQQRGMPLGRISVADLMRRGPFWCRADDSADRVLAAMDRLKTDTLAVLDVRGRVLGTIHRDRLAQERQH